MNMSENMGKRAALRGKALSFAIAVVSGLLSLLSFLELKKIVDWDVVHSITGNDPGYSDVLVLAVICAISILVHVGINIAIKVFSR